MAYGSLRVTEAMASFTSSPSGSYRGVKVESPWLGDPIHLTGLNAIHMLFITRFMIPNMAQIPSSDSNTSIHP